jgi:ribosomal protein S18 acetylase RimI-like enzyme
MPGPAPRLATVDDAATVGDLLHRFAAEFGEPTPGPEALTDRAREALARGESEFLLVGAPEVGIAQLRFRSSVWTGRRDCYLEDLYVVPGERGRGLGRALLDRALALARERGSTHVELATHEEDKAARGLYESSGFTYREDGGAMLFYVREL